MTTEALKLILVDINPALCSAFKQAFEGLPNVQVVNGMFEQVAEYDCMVSPANSFGLMDGGIDAAITSYFGAQLMQRVQDYIIAEYLGEQPVGTSFIIETKHPQHAFLAHTPTMRVPMAIARTDHVYVAMAAMLRAVYHHNKSTQTPICSVLCPGLGTATGQVPFREAARQMALAYKNFLKPPLSISWHLAGERQSEVRYGGDMGFDFPAE